MTEDEERDDWHKNIGTLYHEGSLKDLVHCPSERDLTDWLQAMDAVCTAASGVLREGRSGYDITNMRWARYWILRGQKEAEALDLALNRMLSF